MTAVAGRCRCALSKKSLQVGYLHRSVETQGMTGRCGCYKNPSSTHVS